jgi:dipeptidyl-peptidase-4
MLDEIVRDVPAASVAEIKKVPLYFSPSYQKGRSGAEFHPDAGWLRENGRDPVMAQGVEFSGVDDFEAEMRRMPNFALIMLITYVLINFIERKVLRHN